MRIGYVGLGAMGSALAGGLIGHPSLTVYDRDATAVAAFVERGAQAASSLAELARASDVVFLCLPRSSIVREAIFGEGGLAEGLAPGTLLIDQTSGSPAETRSIAEQLELLNVAMVDAPVAGGVPSAQQGSILIMSSGADDDYARAEPCLRLISSNILRSGRRVGDGHAMKLINNAINAICRVGTFELIAMGRRHGLSLAAMIAACDAGIASGRMSNVVLPSVLAQRPSSNFALSLMLKDVNETLTLADECQVSMPLVSIARGVMQIGVNIMGAGAQLEDVAALIENLTSVRLIDPQGRDADSVDDRAVLAAIVGSVAACNRHAAAECVDLGVAYGLSTEDMLSVILKGSAWSAAAELLLRERCGELPAIDQSKTGEAVRSASAMAMTTGAPVFVANAVRSMMEPLSAKAN
jgi:3-hydroxyisobutyrate dehydrogenase